MVCGGESSGVYFYFNFRPQFVYNPIQAGPLVMLVMGRERMTSSIFTPISLTC